MRPLPPALPASSGNSYNIPSTSAVVLFDEFSGNPQVNFVSSSYLTFSFFHLWQPTSQSQNVTVVVENPMTVDDKGKLVSLLCSLSSLVHLLWPVKLNLHFACSRHFVCAQVSNVVVGVTTGGKK